MRSISFIIIFSIVAFSCGSKKESENSRTKEKSRDQVKSATSGPKNEKKAEIARINTRFGDIFIWLYDATPKHKKNFLKLAKKGFYDSTTFHRIIDGFMIQGGDPNSKDNVPGNDGRGGPGYTLPAEIKPDLRHNYGAVSAARKGDQVNPERRSSGSQFYIVENKKGTPSLDGKYTVFGQVIGGMQVVETIAAQPKDQRDRPNKDIPVDINVLEKTPAELKKQFNFTP